MTPFSARGIATRLFFTCWLIYTLHFATNTVREVFLALSIGDHLSYRVDEYGGLHDDLFETPGRGWHIGANPGASMLAAIPYAIASPVINRVVEHVNQERARSGAQPPQYGSPWPAARAFFEAAWRRGLDVKFGLGEFVMQAFCMAPFSAASVAILFYLLRRILPSDTHALWLSLLYAFGTPVFFRTGYINQNMLVGDFALAGFAALFLLDSPRAAILAGLCGGLSILMDYSGAIIAAGLLVYCFLRNRSRLPLYILGTIPPVLLLWHYQWQSFGNPFLPGQNYMPPVEWIDRGYQGVEGPRLDLLWQLAFDYRFGLLLTCPLLALAALAPFIKTPLPRREIAVLLGTAFTMMLFFSGVNYTRLQFNTGIRYLAPTLPLLFIPAGLVLLRCYTLGWTLLAYLLGVAAVAQSWCLAMYRDVERGWGLAEPLLHVFTAGFQLPALTTLGRVQGLEFAQMAPSPLPLFALSGAVLFGIWRRWHA